MRQSACVIAMVAILALAAPSNAAPTDAVTIAATSLTTAAAPSPGSTIAVPEGTEFPMRLEDTLSSKSAQEGDRFTVTLDEDVHLADGVVLRAGYRGVGEVVDARKNGMLGKTGKLAVRLNYVRIGDQRIKLRAARDSQGAHNTGAQVGTLLLVWPVMPFIKGKSTQMRKGMVLTAFSDSDVVLSGPLPPPPPDV